MNTAERIIGQISELRPEKQVEVLEFVEFLKAREEQNEENKLSNFSLQSAMHGMEDEETIYSEEDLVVHF